MTADKQSKVVDVFEVSHEASFKDTVHTEIDPGYGICRRSPRHGYFAKHFVCRAARSVAASIMWAWTEGRP
jgi:hypothetical protein